MNNKEQKQIHCNFLDKIKELQLFVMKYKYFNLTVELTTKKRELVFNLSKLGFSHNWETVYIDGVRIDKGCDKFEGDLNRVISGIKDILLGKKNADM